MCTELIKLNPHLPSASAFLDWSHTRQFRKECGANYYMASLRLSQSYWLQRKQANAILQLNKAFMADLKEPSHPLPYSALVWFLDNRRGGEFLGNPVRHFQHLATRMNAPRKELRTWRAWACFHIAKSVLPERYYPVDSIQIDKEHLLVPKFEEVLNKLKKLGLTNEFKLLLPHQILNC